MQECWEDVHDVAWTIQLLIVVPLACISRRWAGMNVYAASEVVVSSQREALCTESSLRSNLSSAKRLHSSL